MRRHYLFTAAAVVYACIPASLARAAFTFNLTQGEAGTVATGSGTLNTSALSFLYSGGEALPQVFPEDTLLTGGPSTGTLWDGYSGLPRTPALGPGEYSYYATSGSGDVVGVLDGNLEVPYGYVSGGYLSCTDTWAYESFADLGLTPGSYVYTWGSGANADSLTINIGSVPEPMSLAMIGVAALSLGRRPRRKLKRQGGDHI